MTGRTNYDMRWTCTRCNRKPNETCGLVQCQDTMTGTVTGEGDKDMGWTYSSKKPSTVNVGPLPFRAHVFLLHSSPNLQISPLFAPLPTPPPPLLVPSPQSIAPPCLSSRPPSPGAQALPVLRILLPPLAAPLPNPNLPVNSSRHVGPAA